MVQTVIVSGFVHMAFAVAILCWLASIAAGLIRHRLDVPPQRHLTGAVVSLWADRSEVTGIGS
ncbi:hypothetical protein C2W62_23475 [Candidatus Entotheonella serta]|nr:hypothetical protein C2W62_23475 [Candidatus Entotheonella serta]